MAKYHCDYETRSLADISEVGAWTYSKHPSTEVLCLAYSKEGENNVRLWIPPKIAVQFIFNSRAQHKGLIGHFNAVRGSEVSRRSKKEVVLVTGGRDYSDKDELYAVLDNIHNTRGILRIIHGCAKGADSLAGEWAAKNKVKVLEFPADWNTYGKSAGHVRNRQMYDEGKPTLTVAFKGGRGTEGMKTYVRENQGRMFDVERFKGTKFGNLIICDTKRFVPKRGWNWDGYLTLPLWSKYPLSSRPKFLEDFYEDDIIVAHNSFFEMSIWMNKCQKMYGFPEIKLNQWECSAALASSYALPRALDKVGQALDLSVVKDDQGKLAMLSLARPITGTEKFNSDVFKFETLFNYCISDVRAEKEICKTLRPLPEDERSIWLFNQELNLRGLPLDVPTIKSAIKIIEDYTEVLEKEMAELTNGKLTNIRQTAALQLWLEENGVLIDNVQKNTIIEVLSRPNLTPSVRRVLEIRQSLGQTSTSKYYSMLAIADPDDYRARDQYKYHGASTGRETSMGFNAANLPRGNLKQTEEMLRDVSVGDWKTLVEKHGDPLSVLSSCLRGMIKAPEGKKFIVSDYANIEGRVLAWAAGEDWKTQAFRDFDTIIGLGENGKPIRKGPDLYKVMAAAITGKKIEEVTDDERQAQGKVPELACGYGGGVGAFHSMAAIYGVEISDDDAQKVVDLWRSRNPNIKKFWYDLDAAASKAIITGTKQYCGKVSFFVEDKFLKLQLPSGRCLHYYEPRLEEVETPWGRTKKQVTFMAPNPKTRKWERERTWGGTFSENICQGISRDILFYAMRKARTRRYTSVGSTYDEIIAEVPNNPRFNLEEFNRIISENPPWAPDLPLAVEGFECINYTK